MKNNKLVTRIEVYAPHNKFMVKFTFIVRQLRSQKKGFFLHN